jgi:hypothetical protein
MVIQLNISPNVSSVRRCSILAITWTTGIPSPRYNRNDNSRHADAPLPRGFLLT